MSGNKRMSDSVLPHDPLGAFCRDNHVARRGYGRGPLRGLTFAAKDLFHIKGAVTGFGSPEWLRSHAPSTHTARAVKLLLDAGADMIAKAHCDELCYSLTGENVHYGPPRNVNAAGRITGGSSSGSAAAVAGGLIIGGRTFSMLTILAGLEGDWIGLLGWLAADGPWILLALSFILGLGRGHSRRDDRPRRWRLFILNPTP